MNVTIFNMQVCFRGFLTLWMMAFLLVTGMVVSAGETPSADDEGTVITSRSLNYDQNARTAVFEGDVVVVDPQIEIKAEKLTVVFTEDNEVHQLNAEGNVFIVQNELEATGGRADYDVREGKVVLSLDPTVRRGRDLLSGETITFWRDSNRILCEPNARLVLHSEREAFTGVTVQE